MEGDIFEEMRELGVELRLDMTKYVHMYEIETMFSARFLALRTKKN